MPEPLGIVVALVVVGAVTSTLYWMLHPALSRSALIAQTASTQASEISGKVLVVFSSDINSLVLMALAARMAKRQQATVVAIYVIEVPYTLPIEADLPQAERRALDSLNAAEEVARKAGVDIETRMIRDRQTGTAIVRAAQEESASLIVMGTYREHGYAGAPLAKAIEFVTTHAMTDVLIGVSSIDAKSMLSVAPADVNADKGK
ncbi:MAG TPA: universal stress protein [Magnetospirillaceae bacterium]|nr:universal stress protein [Magnetospirillaceae bacterium]